MNLAIPKLLVTSFVGIAVTIWASAPTSAEDLNSTLRSQNSIEGGQLKSLNGTNVTADAQALELTPNTTSSRDGLKIPEPQKRNRRPKTETSLPTLQPWETFWIDHQVDLAENRAETPLTTAGVKNLVVVVPNQLKESQAPIVIPYSEGGIRELNVVVVTEKKSEPVVADGRYSGVVIGAVVQPRDPRRVERMLGQTNLLAGTVIVQGSRSPDEVNMITKIDRVERRGSAPIRRRPSSNANPNRP